MTITIFIPAYNEEKNIERLFRSLQSQILGQHTLEHIIVAISGTDSTKSIVESLQIPKLTIVYTEERKSKAYMETIVFSSPIATDILVGIDADCTFETADTLKTLLDAFKDTAPRLVCSNPKPKPPQNLIEKIGCFGDMVWEEIRDKIRGNKLGTVHDCNGRLYALSAHLLPFIKVPDTSGDDMYIACRATELGHPIVFVREAHILYKTPGKFSDYVRQHMRYDTNTMPQFFSKEFLAQFKISSSILIPTLLKTCLKHPFMGPVYCSLRTFVKACSLFYTSPAKWHISSSTKEL